MNGTGSVLARTRYGTVQGVMEQMRNVWTLRQTWRKVRRIRQRADQPIEVAPGRQVKLWKVLFWGVLGFFGLQVGIVGALSVVSVNRRRRARRVHFPHMLPHEVQVGEDRIQIYTYGVNLYDAMIEAIESARDCIYIETFIWKGDEVGQRFKDALEKKAAEGVKVYVVFDWFGNLVVPHAFRTHWRPDIRRVQFQSIRRPWHLLDPRHFAVDHRKVLIVDNRVGFLGGYNFGKLYSTEWRDTHFRIVGPSVTELTTNFVDFWNRLARKRERIPDNCARGFDPLFSLSSNDPLRLTFPIRDMYLSAIDHAQHHIYLTNAYFVPDHVLLDALKLAARRGVDVEILVPWTSNHILADWISRSYFQDCLEAGIRLWGYRDAMIHAKTCTIDGEWSTIGTANLDRLSAVGNYELNAQIYSEELAAEMEEIYAQDKTNAFEITRERWQHRSWYLKLSERILAPLRVIV